ncbi:MAG: cache domain-containing protein [Elusimicrobiota bacterium]
MRVNKYKFVAAVAFMFLLPFLILARHFMTGNKELEKKDALAYMEMRTRIVANIADDLLRLNYDISKLSSAEDFINASREVRKKKLENRIKENPSIYSEFSVLDASGREVLKIGPAASKDLKDYSKSELFKTAVSEHSSSGAVEYSEYTPPALVLVAPLTSGRGDSAKGFLLARMSLAYIGEIVRVMGRNSPGNMGFVDAGGQLISDSLGHSIISPGIKAPAEVLRAVDAASAKGLDDFKNEVSLKGRPYLVSVANINGTRWWVFEVVDAAKPLNYTASFWAKRVILIGILLILIFSFISYKLAQRWLVSGRE